MDSKCKECGYQYNKQHESKCPICKRSREIEMKGFRLAKSSITDNVYIGKVKANGIEWQGEKTDVTNDFIKAVIERWNGYSERISDGKKTYEVTVREI
jgi:hypothetical protein